MARAREPARLAHLRPARPARHRRRAARAARARAGTAVRLRRLAARQPDGLSPERTDHRGDRRRRLRRARDGQPRIPLPVRRGREPRARQMQPSADLFQPRRSARSAAAVRARRRRSRASDGAETWNVRVFSLLVVAVSGDGSPWERVFGWRFLDPIDGRARGRGGDARRHGADRCSRTSACARDRRLAERRAAPRPDAGRAQPRHCCASRSSSAACRSCTRVRTARSPRAPSCRWRADGRPRRRALDLVPLAA